MSGLHPWWPACVAVALVAVPYLIRAWWCEERDRYDTFRQQVTADLAGMPPVEHHVRTLMALEAHGDGVMVRCGDCGFVGRVAHGPAAQMIATHHLDVWHREPAA
jgi:hypothetical protein